jgi:hypothetical protein
MSGIGALSIAPNARNEALSKSVVGSEIAADGGWLLNTM